MDGQSEGRLNVDHAPMDRPSGEVAVYTISEEPLRSLFSILLAGGNLFELAELVVATQVTGLEVPENSSDVPQGGDGGEVSITIDLPTEPESMHTATPSTLLPRVLLTLAMLTLIIDIGTMLYKPPRGVVFGHHMLLYYLTLAGIFVVGVAEAWTAIWISRSHDAYRPLFFFERVVLCVSIVSFVIIVAIGGASFISG